VPGAINAEKCPEGEISTLYAVWEEQITELLHNSAKPSEYPLVVIMQLVFDWHTD
jgi:hypothetical protein